MKNKSCLSTLHIYVLTFMLGLFILQVPAKAQESTTEFWPEVDVWLRVSPEWRFSVFVPVSKNIETKYREGNLILQADYAWGKTKRPQIRRLLDENLVQIMKPYLGRAGYLGARSLDDKGEAYNEKMAFAEFHLRTPFKGQVLISHRVRPECRWIGDENDFSTRLRYRFMIEKEYKIRLLSLVPYVNVEPYYDSRYSTVNRIRAIGGATITWSNRYAIESNFTYQYDSKSSVTHLYALNVILHVYFNTNGELRNSRKTKIKN